VLYCVEKRPYQPIFQVLAEQQLKETRNNKRGLIITLQTITVIHVQSIYLLQRQVHSPLGYVGPDAATHYNKPAPTPQLHNSSPPLSSTTLQPRGRRKHSYSPRRLQKPRYPEGVTRRRPGTSTPFPIFPFLFSLFPFSLFPCLSLSLVPPQGPARAPIGEGGEGGSRCEVR